VSRDSGGNGRLAGTDNRQRMIAVLRYSVRPALAGLIVITGLGVGALAATGRGPTWDGTWAGGWENGGDGVQIIITSSKVIGVFRHGDYPDIQRSQLSADGKMLTFAWAGGEATLQRTGEDDARITLRERGKPERNFTVKRE
jgi:hypothetical protein